MSCPLSALRAIMSDLYLLRRVVRDAIKSRGWAVNSPKRDSPLRVYRKAGPSRLVAVITMNVNGVKVVCWNDCLVSDEWMLSFSETSHLIDELVEIINKHRAGKRPGKCGYIVMNYSPRAMVVPG